MSRTEICRPVGTTARRESRARLVILCRMGRSGALRCKARYLEWLRLRSLQPPAWPARGNGAEASAADTDGCLGPQICALSRRSPSARLRTFGSSRASPACGMQRSARPWIRVKAPATARRTAALVAGRNRAKSARALNRMLAWTLALRRRMNPGDRRFAIS